MGNWEHRKRLLLGLGGRWWGVGSEGCCSILFVIQGGPPIWGLKA